MSVITYITISDKHYQGSSSPRPLQFGPETWGPETWGPETWGPETWGTENFG